jgi:PAS domain S-box-containing protein
MFLIDRAGVIAAVNTAGSAFCGKSGSEIVGSPVGNGLNCRNAATGTICGRSDPCSSCPLRLGLVDVFGSSEPARERKVVLDVLRAGYSEPVSLSLSLIPVSEGQDDFALIAFTDETGQKRTEKKLRESQADYRLLVDSLTDLLVKVDTEGRFIFVSPSYCALFGATPEELIGRHFMPLIHEEDREATARAMEGLATPPHTAYMEQRAMTCHGWRWIAWRDSAILDDHGNIRSIVGLGRDITRQKTVEESLRESEERFARAFRSNPVAQVITEIETGMFTDANDRWIELLGYTADELIGRTSKEVGIWKNPHDRDRLIAAFKNQGYIRDEPVLFVNKAGEILHVRWSAVSISAGGMKVLLSTVHDETGQVRVREALRESEERYRLLSDLTMEAIVIHKNGRIKDMNRAATRMFGYDFDDLVGKDAIEAVIVEEDRDIIREQIVRSHARPYVVRCRRKNGDLFHAEIEAEDFETKEEILRVAAIRDVSERIEAQKALKESQERLANVMVAINDGIWDWDIPSGSAYFDERYYTMAGYASDAFAGSYEEYKNRVHPDDLPEVEEHLREHFQGKNRDFDVEFRFRKQDGTWMWIRSRGMIVERDDRDNPRRMVGTHTDVTDRYLMAEIQEKLQAQLDQAQKMETLGILAGGVAHDFNNLLQAMGGNIDMLLLNRSEDDMDRLRLETIRKSITRAGNLVRQLLLFSRKDPGRRQKVDLDVEIREAVEILRRTIPKMIEVECSFSPDPWPIEADPVQVEQVLFNLGRNASDAMPSGGRLHIATSNECITEDQAGEQGNLKPGSYVRMTVADTGCGMDPRTLEHIFDPFFTTKELGKGTGLGLSSVYGVVQSHGGMITCSSRPGRGTAFVIHWPAMESATEEIPVPEVPGLPESGHETILVVDDDQDIRDLTVEALEAFGYRMLEAQSGEEALAVCSRWGEPVDLVVLDLGMPGMGGRHCLKELVQRYPEINVLIASGYLADSSEEDMRKQGARGFIGKPYNIADLLAVVRRILDHPQ